ncbi:MAG: BON domain-containing protein [Planctomycetales bacterium]|nr:BON domain-containing protein [Planctomycetales bacterium]
MLQTYILHDAHDSCDLRDRIHLVLSRAPHLIGRPIQVEVVDHEVLLTGTVRSYFQKQMAQESLRHVPGLGVIRNQLAVTAATRK